MILKVKLLREGIKLPAYQTAGAACFDISSPFAVDMVEGQLYDVPLGFAVEVPVGYKLLLRPRSSLVLRHRVILANGVAVIDSDYRGEIHALLFRLRDYSVRPETHIEAGERILQAELQPVIWTEIVPAKELSTTARGPNGLGSTGRM